MNHLHNEDLHNWLWEVLVVEEQCEELFDGQADQLKHYPRIQARLDHEANCARAHRKILSIRLQQLGFNTAIFRDNIEGLIQVSPSLLRMCMSHNVQEGMFALLTLTQMEITSFKTIEKAAEVLNDSETQELSEAILRQLNTRAQWMSQVITELTQNEFTPQAA